MHATRADVVPDDSLDIRLSVENIERKEGAVAYYATCVDREGDRVMLTVFRNNLPEVELREGERYEFADVRGEIWDDGTPAVKFTSQSSATPVTSTHDRRWAAADSPRAVERGYDVETNELVSIELLVNEFEPVGENSIAYRAWCSDRYGDLVIFTAFENTQPETTPEAGDRYEFRGVVGETWEDGTPGIKSVSVTTVERLRSRTDESDESHASAPEEARELTIDAVDDRQFAHQSADEGRWFATLPSWFGVAVSGLATGVAILASLFAGGAGLWTKVAFVVVGTVVAAMVAYISQYEPASRLQTRRKRKHTQVFLKILLQDYLETVGDGPEIRASVMTTSSPGLLERDSLRIFSFVGEFEPSEREARYTPRGNRGPWARAFDNREIVAYDRETMHESIADLDVGTRKVIEDVRSSVSVPVYTDTGVHRNPVGVVTLDSAAPIEETGFTDEEVQTLLRRYSTLIGEVLE